MLGERRIGGSLSTREFETRIIVRTLASSVVGAAMLWIDMVVFYPVYPASHGLRPLLVRVAIAAVPYYIAAATVGWIIVRRRFRAATTWLSEGRGPTVDEIADLAAQPRRIANQGLLYWTISFAWTMPFLHFVVGYRPGLLAMGKIAIAYVLAGLTAWTLTYITVDRALRPLRALVVSGDLPRWPRTIGVFPLLLLVWIVVSARPLIEAGGMLVGLDPEQLQHVVPVIWGICIVSLIAGITVTGLSARALTDPLERLRRGLEAVERGNLKFEVPVDETGEIGLLQAGFNRMVSGLRERERMRDLFGRHVGSAVAQRALDGEIALGGELCDATVMFIDVIGSTQMAETMSPTEVVLTLNVFFDSIVRIVGAEGGLVNKFEGDGALCVFGAPTPSKDHASRAVRAARTLCGELEPLLASCGISAAIGVSSGTLVAGNVGAVDRYEFTVIGDPVNEAARLTDEAKLRAARLLVSESTITGSGLGEDGWLSVGPLLLRGRTRPSMAYEPDDLESRPSRGGQSRADVT